MIRGSEIPFVPGVPFLREEGIASINYAKVGNAAKECTVCGNFRAKSAFKNGGDVCRGCRDDIIPRRTRQINHEKT